MELYITGGVYMPFIGMGMNIGPLGPAATPHHNAKQDRQGGGGEPAIDQQPTHQPTATNYRNKEGHVPIITGYGGTGMPYGGTGAPGINACAPGLRCAAAGGGVGAGGLNEGTNAAAAAFRDLPVDDDMLGVLLLLVPAVLVVVVLLLAAGAGAADAAAAAGLSSAAPRRSCESVSAITVTAVSVGC
jgi:hypothetical protein